MKKKLIALAIAGAMTAPMAAMADVKISGQLQSQLVMAGGSDASSKGLYLSDGGALEGQNSGSWGALNINASEDLGGGLKALANYAFNITTGNGIGTRTAYVGLAGDFGAVLAGRLNHPYKTSTIGWDPFVGTFMQARFNGGMGGTTGALYGSELDNAVAYAGAFGGVKVVAAVVLDESNNPDNDKTNGDHIMAFSVNAPVGPVEVAVAYADLGGDKTTAAKVGVKYAAGDFSVAGQYEMFGEGLGDGNAMFVTGSYKMGANTLSVSVGSSDEDQMDGTYMAVGVNHAMSAKTSVHAGYRASDLADGNYKTNTIGAGLRVRF